MEDLITILSKFDVANLIAMVILFWMFKNHQDKKFDKLENKMEERFEKVDKRFEQLEQRMTSLEKNMIEVKTILRFKECCMIKDEKSNLKELA